MGISVKRFFLLVSGIFLSLWIAACSLGGGEQTNAKNEIASIVAATMQQMQTQVSTPLPTLAVSFTPSAGSNLPGSTTSTMTFLPTNTLAPTTPAVGGTETPTITSTPGIGALSGGVYGYPYGSIPRLIFIAFNQVNGTWKYWIDVAGASYYSTDMFIPEGKYQVVAYDAAGHAGGCTTIAIVKANQTEICDITDWTGSYPSKPSDAPNP